MDLQDQRKRAFSQAFQLINQPRVSENHLQPAKRTLTYPPNSTRLCLRVSGQENEAPLDLDCAPAFNETPQTHIPYKAPVDLRFADPASYDHASLQCELYGNDWDSAIRTNLENIPPPVISQEPSKESHQPVTSLLTPLIVRGQSMFGPSPYVRPDLSSPSENSVDPDAQDWVAYTDYNNTNFPLSDLTTLAGPLTPSALNFSGLSLNSQGYSVPPSPLPADVHCSRTTVTLVPTSSITRYSPDIQPNEVVVVFDQGKEVRKVDKYPLCIASRFFAQLLDGPFLDPGLTRRLRLRDDFPYAISIMLHFIETGHYVFDQRAFERHPLLTTLDFHIHAYLTSIKYGIAALRECVCEAYLSIAEHELNLGFLVLSNEQLFASQVPVPGFPIAAPADGYAGDGDLITPIDRFLNSLVLLWKNTHSRHDALRKAVLELVKRDLNKLIRVRYFVTLLQEMAEFGDDLVASLGDDGFDVQADQVDAGGRQACTIRFGV